MIAPIGPLGLSAGGPIGAHFAEVWMCDFEFGGDDGEHPRVRCMVAKEYRSRREIRMRRMNCALANRRRSMWGRILFLLPTMHQPKWRMLHRSRLGDAGLRAGPVR